MVINFPHVGTTVPTSLFKSVLSLDDIGMILWHDVFKVKPAWMPDSYAV
jgi:hypothetical protein